MSRGAAQGASIPRHAGVVGVAEDKPREPAGEPTRPRRAGCIMAELLNLHTAVAKKNRRPLFPGRCLARRASKAPRPVRASSGASARGSLLRGLAMRPLGYAPDRPEAHRRPPSVGPLRRRDGRRDGLGMVMVVHALLTDQALNEWIAYRYLVSRKDGIGRPIVSVIASSSSVSGWPTSVVSWCPSVPRLPSQARRRCVCVCAGGRSCFPLSPSSNTCYKDAFDQARVRACLRRAAETRVRREGGGASRGHPRLVAAGPCHALLGSDGLNGDVAGIVGWGGGVHGGAFEA